MSRSKRNRWKSRGQSFVEFAFFLPILLILLIGVVEVGLLMNEYLNLMDGPREGARFGVDYNPWLENVSPKKDNSIFYDAIAQTTLDSISPMKLDMKRDDVVISVFQFSGTTVTSRYPQDYGVKSDDPQNSWSFQYWCTHYYGSAYDSNTVAVKLGSDYCGESGAAAGSHFSRFSNSDIASMISGSGANSMGAVLVEIYYSYNQLLSLHGIFPFLPDPIPVSSYTIMPVPAAEPKH